MRIFKLSTVLAFAAALFLIPLSPLVAASACGMLGLSATQAQSCTGCCAKMKCDCTSNNHDEKPQPAQGSNSRDESGLSVMAARQPTAILLYPLPTGAEAYRPLVQSDSAPVFSSQARLCIRLI